ncbi:MAG TPA: hypothetical protein VF057_09245 [Thermoanaerobaculia bacterium]
MRPIHTNLAARPYRDYRPVYAVIVVASLLIAFLMLNNIDTYYRYVRETRTTREEIAALEAQTRKEREAADAAVAEIRTIDLETLGLRSRFVNAQLAERAFSWSELLERLESVVPNTVRITSIAPSFDENGLVSLRMNCEAKSSQGMLETISRFHSSPYFSNPFPGSDRIAGDGYAFDLTVTYKPSIPRIVVKR